uniref:Uncharacterized protein n=1 Tax=Panagrolaimus superbus TaxID=310955 RepID=A0A914Y016_9BILA
METCNLGTDDENRDLIYVKRLAENICHQCLAERKDYRENSLKIAVNFVKLLPPKLVQVKQFFFFAVNYGYLNNQRSRLVAVDLVSILLETFDVASFPNGVTAFENVDYEFGAIAEAVEYDDSNFHQKNPTFKKNWENFLYFAGEETFQPRNAMLQLLVRATMDKLAAKDMKKLQKKQRNL